MRRVVLQPRVQQRRGVGDGHTVAGVAGVPERGDPRAPGDDRERGGVPASLPEPRRGDLLLGRQPRVEHAGDLVGGDRPLYQVESVLEKPTPTVAEQQLIVPGLRAGHYLCFFGMHVLTPTAMDLLAEEVRRAGGQGGVHLSPALAKLGARERYLACEIQGRRFDVGAKYGLLTAQLALALEGEDRDEVLSGLIELLALRNKIH